ncbi:MAG: type III pantothenate kinase [Campylobacterales bacterium]|nr:type III pantothenate kinase [Campylobacterales bacterium]
MLLADIGNTHFHIYDGQNIKHLLHRDAIKKYKNQKLLYICVNQAINQKIAKIKKWSNIGDKLSIQGEYPTMGIDRKALCLSKKNGVFIDAGSAITVDFVQDRIYQGGFILPGLQSYLQSYQSISPALKTKLNPNISLKQLPISTKDAISYGIIASIKALISNHKHHASLYFTGGDGKFIASFFKESIYDETLIFKGILKGLKRYKKGKTI